MSAQPHSAPQTTFGDPDAKVPGSEQAQCTWYSQFPLSAFHGHILPDWVVAQASVFVFK